MFIFNKYELCCRTLKQLTILQKVLLQIQTQWYCHVASKNKKHVWCRYSENQQYVILETLNQYLTTNMTRSYLSAKRLKNIKDYLKPRVVLTDLNQLTDVEGIGLISAHQICDKILKEVKSEVKEEIFKTGSLVTPSLPQAVKQKLEKVVGLNIGFNAVSWAQLNCKNHSLLEWNYYELENILTKKYELHDLFHIATHLWERIPDADVYVIENCNWCNISNSKVSVSLQMLRSQLITAILSIFNTQRLNHTDDDRFPELENRVYFLKRRLYARMFHTIVGSECVSAQGIIENIFEMQPDNRYCPVSVDGILQNYYHSLSGSIQDNMNHSLMLVIAFVNIVVLGRQQSLQAFLSSKNKKM